MIHWCSVFDWSCCLHSVRGLTLNTELVRSCNVNKWVAGSQAWILHVYAWRSTDSNWMQRWLRGAPCTMELPLWAPHVPCHVVYRSIRSSEEIHELYIWHTSTAPQHLKVNRADIMRVRDWPFESCGLSHCRPPELQLRWVRFQPGFPSKTTNNPTPLGSSLWGTSPLQK